MYHEWFYGLRIIIMTSSISDDVQATRGTAWWCDVLVACTCDGLPGLTSVETGEENVVRCIWLQRDSLQEGCLLLKI